MTTTYEYDRICAEMPEGLPADIMTVLTNQWRNFPGTNVNRETLILLVFHRVVEKSKLTGSHKDRQIRETIEQLQREGYRVISSSGKPGYRLAVNDEDMESYIAELESRKTHLEEKIRALRTPRPKFEYIAPMQASQPALI
jgi:hypothetical protein